MPTDLPTFLLQVTAVYTMVSNEEISRIAKWLENLNMKLEVTDSIVKLRVFEILVCLSVALLVVWD